MELSSSCATVAHNHKAKGDALPQSQATPQARKEVRVTHLPVKQLFSLPLCTFDVSWCWHPSSSDDLATCKFAKFRKPKALDAAMPRLTLVNENCAIVDGQFHFITVNLLSGLGLLPVMILLPILWIKCKQDPLSVR